MPPTLRFFTGGDVSVRGFGYLRLGPRDSLGNITGGQALMVGSVEADYQLLTNWAVAVFTDAGNATNRFSLTNLEHSVGAGIRFLSPVGMIRVDGAFGISRKNMPFRLHLTIGQDL
jgi:translocation and assembly module TamA